MKLTVINSVVNLPSNVFDAMRPYLASLVRPDTEIEYVGIQSGFPSIESDMHGMFNGTEVVREGLRAAERGAEGIFVNCFDDPGVQALREMVDIPVYGEGFDGKIFSVVPADMMVGEVFGGDGVDERLADVCMRMHDEDRIDCVVLGCTGMQQAVARLRECLSSALCPVAVVEPLAAGVTHLERSVALGLTNSLHIGLTLEGLVK